MTYLAALLLSTSLYFGGPKTTADISIDQKLAINTPKKIQPATRVIVKYKYSKSDLGAKVKKLLDPRPQKAVKYS